MEAETSTKKKIFLTINCILLAMGNVGGPLILRLYFIHGGKRLWFTSWLQTAGWPLILIPLLVSYTRRRRATATARAKLFVMNTRVLSAAVVIGVLTGTVNYFYSYGLANLPVSTSSLIIATQLAFTAGFAFVLVKQKFTAYSINAVVLLTAAAAVLWLHASGDRPEGESDKVYWLGFAMLVMAAALYGFVLPLVELTYKKAKQVVTYTLVMEMQLVISFIATVLCTVGMLINSDFQAISREAKEFEVGETKYYVVVVCIGIIVQCFFMGSIGVIFYSSSLLSGIIIITVSLPRTEVLAVFIFHENFKAEKGTSLFLSFWGLLSYFWGEHNANNKNHKHNDDDHMPPHQTSHA